MNLPTITNSIELAKLVDEIGFLPMFRSSIEGYSLEDCTPKKYWFVKGVEGPWEWREQIAEKGNIAYAKLFNKKAGFVNLKWYPEIANYRRDGYDFDARYEDGLASRQCMIIMDLLTKHGSLLSTEIKSYGEFGKDGLKGFETAMTALQMQTYITVKQFEYKQDKDGKKYGWGIGRYICSEDMFGAELVHSKYGEDSKVSYQKLASHLKSLFPDVTDKQIFQFLK